MAFTKGQSGNPTGRPKKTMADGRHISDVAKEHTEEAINALVAVLRQPDASASAIVQAATALLDRGWGRPSQTVAIEAPNSTIGEQLKEAQRRHDVYLRQRLAGDEGDDPIAA